MIYGYCYRNVRPTLVVNVYPPFSSSDLATLIASPLPFSVLDLLFVTCRSLETCVFEID